MKVKLQAYTQPVDELEEKIGDELRELVAYVARVSNPTNQFNTETSERLVDYLINHKHWSPLEMVDIVLEIETTRDIARQILRHRSFSFQEFSQRYANPLDENSGLSFEYREARLQDQKNRQNSIETQDVELEQAWGRMQKRVLDSVKEAYAWAIDNGIAKEQARAVLPEGMTKSRMYMKGSLRSWIHYIMIRTEKGTQKEHRDVALECAKEISKVFPQIENFVWKEPKIETQQLTKVSISDRINYYIAKLFYGV